MKNKVKLLGLMSFVLVVSMFGFGANFAQAVDYTATDVATHNTAGDCWLIINNQVYNVTTFIPIHPGGNAIVPYCGADATIVFDNIHNSEVTALLPTYLIGNLVTSSLPGSLSAEDFGVVNYDTGLGILKGYTAGFGLTDATFAGAQSVVVKLYRGTTLLQTNTGIMPKINADVTGVQISSPFDVSGTFNYVTDGYWTNVRASQYGQSVAANRVVATVTLANGKIVTAENTILTGDPTTIFSSPPIGGGGGDDDEDEVDEVDDEDEGDEEDEVDDQDEVDEVDDEDEGDEDHDNGGINNNDDNEDEEESEHTQNLRENRNGSTTITTQYNERRENNRRHNDD